MEVIQMDKDAIKIILEHYEFVMLSGMVTLVMNEQRLKFNDTILSTYNYIAELEDESMRDFITELDGESIRKRKPGNDLIIFTFKDWAVLTNMMTFLKEEDFPKLLPVNAIKEDGKKMVKFFGDWNSTANTYLDYIIDNYR